LSETSEGGKTSSKKKGSFHENLFPSSSQLVTIFLVVRAGGVNGLQGGGAQFTPSNVMKDGSGLNNVATIIL
jgi:hypothetical protein